MFGKTPKYFSTSRHQFGPFLPFHLDKISNFYLARVENLIVICSTINYSMKFKSLDEISVIFLTMYEIFG